MWAVVAILKDWVVDLRNSFYGWRFRHGQKKGAKQGDENEDG